MRKRNHACKANNQSVYRRTNCQTPHVGIDCPVNSINALDHEVGIQKQGNTLRLIMTKYICKNVHKCDNIGCMHYPIHPNDTEGECVWKGCHMYGDSVCILAREKQKRKDWDD